MARAPLSARHDPEALADYAALHDGMPEWMLPSAQQWAAQFFTFQGRPLSDEIHEAEQYLRLQLSRNGLSSPDWNAGQDLLRRMADDRLGLDVIDYCLSTITYNTHRAATLQEILDRSGSAWTIGRDTEGAFCLERRVDPTAQAIAQGEMSQSGNAAIHLRSAWHLAYGRGPNPSAAYRDAIRAVEAAARSVVTPNDSLATLGKMNNAIRDAPHKWITEIGDVDTVLKMMQTVWKAQHDRHGTDDESAPVNVSAAEAEAAVNLAVALVQMFRTGAIRLAPTT